MMFDLPKIWLGSEESYFNFCERRRAVMENPQTLGAYMNQMRSEWDDDDGDEEPFEERMASELIEVYDGVGVISVEGNLVNEESFWNQFFGEVGYGTVIRAVNQLLDDSEVHSIVMSYASGGGSADGVSEAGDSIKAASLIKPVYSHTGSAMLSAAYWLGSSGGQVRSTKMAETGSIGAVATFLGMHRRLKEAGIDPYISRSTPLKALPHPAEPLTDAGKQQIDEDVHTLHGFFIDHVVSNRSSLSSEGAVDGWASGETFYGAEAMSLGLVDGPLITLNDLITQLNVDHNDQSSGDFDMPKRVVLKSEADRAKLAAGTPLTELGVTQEVPDVTESATDAAAAGADANPTAADATDESASSAGTALEGTVETASTGEDGLTAYLRSEVTELKEANTKLTADLAEATRGLETATQTITSLEKMRPALEQSIERLQVALGHRAIKLDGMPVDSLVATYEALNTELMGLPVGQKTVQEESPRDGSSGEPTSMEEYRLRMIPKTA